MIKSKKLLTLKLEGRLKDRWICKTETISELTSGNLQHL